MNFPQISETPALLDYFLDDEVWSIALRNVEETVKVLREYKGISTKTISEVISGVVAEELSLVMNEKHELADYFFRIGSNDNEPDMVVEDVNGDREWKGVVEIKTAKGSADTLRNYCAVWRGGRLSKRDGDYFFVSYDYVDGAMQWFVCYCHVKKSNWNHTKQGRYYAITIDTPTLIGNHLGEVVIGALSWSSQNNQRFLIEAV